MAIAKLRPRKIVIIVNLQKKEAYQLQKQVLKEMMLLVSLQNLRVIHL